MKFILLYLMSIFYTIAGLLHFIIPEFYLRMIPSILGFPNLINYLSGIAEIILGLILLYKPFRSLACYGIIALLIAVFPANIYMLLQAINGVDYGIPLIGLYIRLPFQFLFIYWAWSMRNV